MKTCVCFFVLVLVSLAAVNTIMVDAQPVDTCAGVDFNAVASKIREAPDCLGDGQEPTNSVEQCCAGIQDGVNCACAELIKQLQFDIPTYSDAISKCKINTTKIAQPCAPRNICTGEGVEASAVRDIVGDARMCLGSNPLQQVITDCCPDIQKKLKCVCSKEAKQQLQNLEAFSTITITSACTIEASQIGDSCGN